MFVKNSLLLAALTASSAVARLHGHERRHAHPKHEIEIKPQVAPEIEAEVEKRDVGDVVTATIDGVLVTWINKWSGEMAATTTSSSSTSTVIQVPTTTAAAKETQVPSAIESLVPAHTATPGSSGSWSDLPANGQYSREGFGGSNYKIEALGIEWTGNTGLPWGSNIIEVEESVANQYKHVVRFEGSNTDDWTVIFWNKKGPNGLMDGFFHPNKALSFTLGPNEVKYVAIDTESTGGWAAWKGDEAPLSEYGSYAATWGEFTMRDAPNFTSWDVSCIQAQNAGKEIQGMQICQHDGSSCSSITNGMGSVKNAYTSAETDINGIGGNVMAEAIRLVVNLDYA